MPRTIVSNANIRQKKFYTVSIVVDFDWKITPSFSKKKDKQHSYIEFNSRLILASNEEEAKLKYLLFNNINKENCFQYSNKICRKFISNEYLGYKRDVNIISDNLPLDVHIFSKLDIDNIRSSIFIQDATPYVMNKSIEFFKTELTAEDYLEYTKDQTCIYKPYDLELKKPILKLLDYSEEDK